MFGEIAAWALIRAVIEWMGFWPFTGFLVLLSVATFIAYLLLMRLKHRRERNGGLEWYHWLWGAPLLVYGIILDAALNVVVGLLGGEVPQLHDPGTRWLRREWLLTARLDRWARCNPGPRAMGRFRSQPWRHHQAFARFACRQLNRIDPGHCFVGM